jgi:hypothetical protein
MENLDKKQGEVCEECKGGCCGGHMHGHCHGRGHLVKIILKIVIVILIFWCGFKLGEITGSIRGGYGRANFGMIRTVNALPGNLQAVPATPNL